MSCFKCRHTGEVCCDEEEQELKCHICNRCEAERLEAARVADEEGAE